MALESTPPPRAQPPPGRHAIVTHASPLTAARPVP
ncbi:hypothetical protein ACP70R_026150 [Stipagrostis hirtigluma subsp. patula]